MPSEAPTDDSVGAHVGDDDHDADAGAYLEAAPKDELLSITMTNFAFTPEVLEVGAGEVLEIAIENVESLVHDFTIDEIDADVYATSSRDSSQHTHTEEPDVHFALTEPGSGFVYVKIHEPGEYVFYCSVPGHRDAGMEGTLTVR